MGTSRHTSPTGSTLAATAAKPCACTGVRWCARCLDGEIRARFKLDDPVPMPDLLRRRPSPAEHSARPIHFFDPTRQTAPGCPGFRGLRLYEDFLGPDEAGDLLAEIERTPFLPAQSGKTKQHYGPRINFNKRRMNASGFRGVPGYARTLESRLRERVASDASVSEPERRELASALARFETTDVFVLRYQPHESSNLDFHLDDGFGYGELILDLSLESDAFLTFVRGRPNSEVVGSERLVEEPICVRVPLPARSLAVLYGPARFEWEHAVLAYDVEAQRTSVTLRTLGPALRQTDAGRDVLERARQSPVPTTFARRRSSSSNTS